MLPNRHTRAGLYIGVKYRRNNAKVKNQTLQSGYFLREHMCLLSSLTINQILVALALLNKVPAVLRWKNYSKSWCIGLLCFEDLLTVIDLDQK